MGPRSPWPVTPRSSLFWTSPLLRCSRGSAQPTRKSAPASAKRIEPRFICLLYGGVLALQGDMGARRVMFSMEAAALARYAARLSLTHPESENDRTGTIAARLSPWRFPDGDAGRRG